MRIRSQLIGAAALAVAVTLLIVAGLGHVTQRAQQAFDAQTEAQQIARDVANMLALTNEVAVYGGERAATQWRSRHAQLQTAVEHAASRHDPPAPELAELRHAVDDLPGLFSRLAEISHPPGTPLAQRRRDLLLERLLAETQQVVEARHRWAVAIGEAQQREQRFHSILVLAAPAALLVLLVALGLVVARRILRPLERLKAAVAAIQAGDLDVRCASTARDELGEAARAVDAMALTLQRQSAALRASEQRLRTIADNLPAMIAYIDRDETYRFTNAQYKRVFGQAPESYLGKSMTEVMGAATRAELEPHVRGVLAGERREFERSGMSAKSGSVFMVNYIPQINPEGGVDGFYVMAHDITTRKQAELRLAASERLLVDITDNMPALVGYIGRDQRYHFANRKYQEWFGIDHRAMIGQRVEDAMGAEFYALVRDMGDAALAGERVRWERESVRDGAAVSLLSEFIPDIGPDGTAQGFYSLTIDITERRRAEQAIARSEQRLFDLTNNIPAMVAYFDMDERCQYANDTALRAQGLQRADVPGITLRAAIGESNYAQHEPYVRQALAGRRARLDGKIPFETRVAHFQAHLVPDRVDGGEQRGFYLMTFDITALKEAQQKQERVERKLRDITDNLPVLISYVDRNERYVFLNATCKAWLGVDPAALIGHSMQESMAAENYAQRSPHITAALAGERVEFNVESLALGINRSLQSTYVPDIQPDGSVAGFYTLTTDISELKRIERQLTQLARFDALTGLPNRRHFEERLEEAIARAGRDRKPVAVMFLDIDHFKAINDGRGHAAGDAVLKEFAARLRNAVRVTDVPARLAGDEFVVLLEGITGERDAATVAEKVVAAIRQSFLVDGAVVPVTTSIGVAFAAGITHGAELMEIADRALYAAKAAGRNTFRVARLETVYTELGALIE